jgi:TrmH family RNA methyltransferase
MPISKNQISRIKLLHQAKGRAESGYCIAEGQKLVTELAEMYAEDIEIYATDVWAGKWSLPEKAMEKLNLINMYEMEKISAMKNPAGILALVPIPHVKRRPGHPARVLWLDAIRDPGNMGTLIRTAEWFGFEEVWCSSGCADPFAPKVVQAAMGSVFRVAVFNMDEEMLQQALQFNKREVYGAFMDGENCQGIKKQESLALLIGNEGQGISPEAEALVTRRISIPRLSGTAYPESLNAAGAAAVLMYSLSRQSL